MYQYRRLLYTILSISLGIVCAGIIVFLMDLSIGYENRLALLAGLLGFFTSVGAIILIQVI